MEAKTNPKAEASVAARQEDLRRIARALEAAAEVCGSFSAGTVAVEFKDEGGPVTALDRGINERLLQLLPRDGEGWLSEESADDQSRLQKSRVWVVDPLDGTHEFLAGIPEWCISIALVEDGRAVAGGICNPTTGETFLGSRETGVTLNGKPVRARACRGLESAVVLASRSETKRGEWERFRNAPFEVRPVGSVAYKLACVAAGLADATWTFVPKHEWDVAAGAALVLASGGVVKTLEGAPPVFNRPNPWLDGLLAYSAGSQKQLESFLAERRKRGEEGAR